MYGIRLFHLCTSIQKMFIMKCFVCLGTKLSNAKKLNAPLTCIKMVSYAIVVVVMYLVIPHHDDDDHAILIQWQRTSKNIMV